MGGYVLRRGERGRKVGVRGLRDIQHKAKRGGVRAAYLEGEFRIRPIFGSEYRANIIFAF